MLDFKIADLVKDSQMLQIARQKAIEILTEDENITKPENKYIAARLFEMTDPKSGWSRIS